MVESYHEQWRGRISDYHDGGLSPRERTEVEAHLASCDECRQVLQRYQQLYQGLRATRGFEGLLPVARPPRRMRFPRQPLPWRDTAGGRPQFLSGIAAILLILVMALTVVAGRADSVLGPQQPAG